MGLRYTHYRSSTTERKLIFRWQIAPLRYRHIGSAAGLLGVWVFTFITVFGGGIALKTVGARIWIWPLVFNIIAVIFVYFMCPDVGITISLALTTRTNVNYIAHWQDAGRDRPAVR